MNIRIRGRAGWRDEIHPTACYGPGPEKDLGWRDGCRVRDLMGSEKPLGADGKPAECSLQRATDAWLP